MTEPEFLGIPERWLDDPTWKCANGHVSKRFLKSEQRGDLCLACQQPVRLCDPNEREVDLYPGPDNYENVKARYAAQGFCEHGQEFGHCEECDAP